jgi:hypothetical protein
VTVSPRSPPARHHAIARLSTRLTHRARCIQSSPDRPILAAPRSTYSDQKAPETRRSPTYSQPRTAAETLRPDPPITPAPAAPRAPRSRRRPTAPGRATAHPRARRLPISSHLAPRAKPQPPSRSTPSHAPNAALPIGSASLCHHGNKTVAFCRTPQIGSAAWEYASSPTASASSFSSGRSSTPSPR